ncbi:hypothetical protein MRX96_014502 [Rhipicephalus microplus]
MSVLVITSSSFPQRFTRRACGVDHSRRVGSLDSAGDDHRGWIRGGGANDRQPGRPRGDERSRRPRRPPGGLGSPMPNAPGPTSPRRHSGNRPASRRNPTSARTASGLDAAAASDDHEARLPSIDQATVERWVGLLASDSVDDRIGLIDRARKKVTASWSECGQCSSVGVAGKSQGAILFCLSLIFLTALVVSMVTFVMHVKREIGAADRQEQELPDGVWANATRMDSHADANHTVEHTTRRGVTTTVVAETTSTTAARRRNVRRRGHDVTRTSPERHKPREHTEEKHANRAPDQRPRKDIDTNAPPAKTTVTTATTKSSTSSTTSPTPTSSKSLTTQATKPSDDATPEASIAIRRTRAIIKALTVERHTSPTQPTTSRLTRKIIAAKEVVPGRGREGDPSGRRRRSGDTARDGSADGCPSYPRRSPT